jgi:hypothetical protein
VPSEDGPDLLSTFSPRLKLSAMKDETGRPASAAADIVQS